MMQRLTRILAVLLLLLPLGCSRQVTTTASTDTQPPPSTEIIAMTPPAATPLATPLSTPAIESVPTAETIPSILRRDSTATKISDAPMEVTDDFPPRVTGEQLKSMMDANKAVVVDVRAESFFKERHISGSLNIPLGEIVLRENEIPADKTIVTVCT